MWRRRRRAAQTIWLQCLLFDVSQPFVAAFFCYDSRGTAARARLFGLQCLRECLLFGVTGFRCSGFFAAPRSQQCQEVLVLFFALSRAQCVRVRAAEHRRCETDPPPPKSGAARPICPREDCSRERSHKDPARQPGPAICVRQPSLNRGLSSVSAGARPSTKHAP